MTSTAQSVDDLRRAFSHFATGVTIVTMVDEKGARVGMTANSFSSLSLDPPLVLWSVAKSSTNYQAFCSTGHFAIHVLDSRQSLLARRFAAKETNRFSDLETTCGHGNVPVLSMFHACFECETYARHEGGDHTIIIGLVRDTTERPGDPLLFYRGKFSMAAPLDSA